MKALVILSLCTGAGVVLAPLAPFNAGLYVVVACLGVGLYINSIF